MNTGPDAGLMWIVQIPFLVAGELSDGLVKYSVKSAAKTALVRSYWSLKAVQLAAPM